MLFECLAPPRRPDEGGEVFDSSMVGLFDAAAEQGDSLGVFRDLDNFLG